MWANRTVGAILLMGGEGRRFKSTLPKQFHRLAGKPVFIHTLEKLLHSQLFDEIVLACHKDWIDRVRIEVEGMGPIKVVEGGGTRQESSYLGLKGFSKKPDLVLIHDAVRPFLTDKILKENIEGALKWGAVDTCIGSTDTLVYAPNRNTIGSIPLREDFFRGQTPQTFQYSPLLQAHEAAIKRGDLNCTDDCQLLLKIGKEVAVVSGDEHNIKITTELDLFLAEQLFRIRSDPLPETKMPLFNRRYAVVGGFGGIGSAICELLKEFQAEAIPLSRRVGLDLTQSKTIKETFEKLGPIDGLINCAGALSLKSLAQYKKKEIETLLQINFTGLVLACQKAQVRPGGHVINLSSSSYTRGRKNYGIYSAAKAAVVNFTQSLAEERPDLRVHAVIPQRTMTPLRSTHFPNEPEEGLLDPKEVAKAVVALLGDSTATGGLIEVRKFYP